MKGPCRNLRQGPFYFPAIIRNRDCRYYQTEFNYKKEKLMKSYQVDKDGYYGEFGGAYIPEILHKCVEELTNTYLTVLNDESFKQEFDQLLRDYVGRPSPLYLARRLSE